MTHQLRDHCFLLRCKWPIYIVTICQLRDCSTLWYILSKEVTVFYKVQLHINVWTFWPVLDSLLVVSLGVCNFIKLKHSTLYIYLPVMVQAWLSSNHIDQNHLLKWIVESNDICHHSWYHFLSLFHTWLVSITMLHILPVIWRWW